MSRGQPVELRPKAWELLCLLLQRPNGVVRSHDLLDALWPRQDVLPKALVNLVSELRLHLGDAGVLRAVPRRGYVLQASPAAPVAGATDAPAAAQTPATAVPARWRPLPGQTFIGRAQALESCRALAAEAASQGLRAWVLQGSAGVGKTALARQATTRLRSEGWTVLSGACVETTGPREPFAPLLQALQAWAHGGGSEALRTLQRYAPCWLALLPGLLDDARWEHLREEMSAASAARLKREVVALLQQLCAKAPVVLFLDDLHWADAETIDLVTALLSAAAGLSLLVVMSWRAREMSHGLAMLAARLEASPLAEAARFEALRCFDEAEATDYVRQRFPAWQPTTEARSELLQQTGGLPLFLKLLCDELPPASQPAGGLGGESTVKDLTRGLRLHVQARVARLPFELRVLMETASCMTAPAPLPLLAHLLEVGEDVVRSRCKALVDLGLFEAAPAMQPWPGGRLVAAYGPGHAMLRQAVAEGLPGEVRRMLCQRLAAALKEAAQLPGSGMVAQRAQACISAGLNVEAAQALQDPRSRWLERLHHRPAIQALAQAFSLLADAGDDEPDTVTARVAVCKRLVDMLPPDGETDRPLYLRALARLLQDTAASPDPESQRLHATYACLQFLQQGRADRAQLSAQTLLQVAGSFGAARQAAAQACRMYVAQALGDHAAVLQAGQQALDLLGDCQDTKGLAPWVGRLQAQVGQALACTGELGHFQARLQVFMASGSHRQVPTLRGFVAVSFADALVQLGCLSSAAALYRGVLECPEEREIPWNLREAWLGLLACQPAQQRPLQTLLDFLDTASSRGPAQGHHVARLLVIDALLARARWAAAAQGLEAAACIEVQWPALRSDLLRLQGRLALGRQQADAARHLWQQALDLDVAQCNLPGALRSVELLGSVGPFEASAARRVAKVFPAWLGTELSGPELAPLAARQRHHRSLLRDRFNLVLSEATP